MIEIDVIAERLMALKVKERKLHVLFTHDTTALHRCSGMGGNTGGNTLYCGLFGTSISFTVYDC